MYQGYSAGSGEVVHCDECNATPNQRDAYSEGTLHGVDLCRTCYEVPGMAQSLLCGSCFTIPRRYNWLFAIGGQAESLPLYYLVVTEFVAAIIQMSIRHHTRSLQCDLASSYQSWVTSRSMGRRSMTSSWPMENFMSHTSPCGEFRHRQVQHSVMNQTLIVLDSGVCFTPTCEAANRHTP
jgi:hypothetical protein